jgi:hypothetical protein
MLWLADALRAEGCRVAEQAGWSSRGRPGAYAPFGTLTHHTATPTSYAKPAPTLNLCINGRSDLPGPLCQVMVGYDGICYVIAAGRANHAGSARATPPIPAGDGNAMLIGFELDYDGTQLPSPEQYQATVLANAACLRRMGRDASYAKGHRETSNEGKPDPGQINLDTLRADIAARLAGAAGPKPPDPSSMGENMVLTDPATGGLWVVADPTGAVWTYDGAPYLGATNNPKMNAANYPCVGIAAYQDARGAGYVLTLDWGDSGKGDGKSKDGSGDRFRRYRFPRDGSGKA